MVDFPTLPAELRREVTRTSVLVRVDIGVDGRGVVTLLESSGNKEVDRLTVETLSQWTWEPAMRRGEPVQSSRKFRYELEVR